MTVPNVGDAVFETCAVTLVLRVAGLKIGVAKVSLAVDNRDGEANLVFAVADVVPLHFKPTGDLDPVNVLRRSPEVLVAELRMAERQALLQELDIGPDDVAIFGHRERAKVLQLKIGVQRPLCNDHLHPPSSSYLSGLAL